MLHFNLFTLTTLYLLGKNMAPNVLYIRSAIPAGMRYRQEIKQFCRKAKMNFVQPKAA